MRGRGVGLGVGLCIGADGSATSAPAWTPASLPGLQLWLRPGAGLFQDAGGTTPAVNSADPVGRWSDQSGRGNHCTQATAGNKPALELAQVNGKSTVRFNGTTSFLQAPDNAGLELSAAAGIFAVLKFGSSTNESIVSKGASAADPDYLFSAFRAGDANGSGISLYDGTGWTDGSAGSVGTAAFYFAECVFGAQVVSFYVNSAAAGINIATGRNWQTSVNPLYIGLQVTTNFITGDIAELIITNQTPSASDRASLESYIRSEFLLW